GEDEGVIRLMRTVPFELIQAVQLPGQSLVFGGPVPMIFLMTTQGPGSGLDMSRRLSVGGDLENNMVYFDGCHLVVKWLRYTATVYDHHNGKLQEAWVGFIQSESYEAVSQLFATWKAIGLRGYDGSKGGEPVEQHVVSPSDTMMDNAEGPNRAMKEQFADQRKIGRAVEHTCSLHFHECRRKHEQKYLPVEWWGAHRDIAEVLLGAKNADEVEAIASEMMEFYKMRCKTEGDAHRMEGWLQYWLQRAAKLVGYREEECLFDPPTREGFATRSNLAEPGHASHLVALGGKKKQMDLAAAVLMSGAAMLLQMSDARARKEGLIGRAGGPTLEDNQRRNEGWRERVQEMGKRLEEGWSVREAQKQFEERVEEAGYVAEPMGTDRILSMTVKRKAGDVGKGKGKLQEDLEETHRADKLRRETWLKKGQSSRGGEEDVGGSGLATVLRADVASAVGGLTVEEMRWQAEGLQWYGKTRETNEADEAMAKKLMEELLEGERLEKEGRIGGGEEMGPDELEERSADEMDQGGLHRGETPVRKNGGARETLFEAEALFMASNAPERLRPDAKKYETEWGLARLKGDDMGSCCGVYVDDGCGYRCPELLNKGVEPGGVGRLVLMKVGPRLAGCRTAGGQEEKIGYPARIKKCARRRCWGLCYTVSSTVALPDPDTHVFPLFEGTEVTEEERVALAHEGIVFLAALPRVKDPGSMFPPKLQVSPFSQSGGPQVYRWLGAAPASGNGPADRKSQGRAREQQRQAKKEREALEHRGAFLVKGKKVRNRTEMTKQMRESSVKGQMYKGKVVSVKLEVDATTGLTERTFTIATEGLAGSDTGMTYAVHIGKLCTCTCPAYRDMMADTRTGFTWCKHIYAVMIKVLGYPVNSPLLKVVAFSERERREVDSKQADLKRLEG
ncbi:hypothetical protein KFL_003410010, partial [Klebsormidium nitens]